MVDKTEFKNCSWAKEEIIDIQNLKEIKMPTLNKPKVYKYNNFHICIERIKDDNLNTYYLEIFENGGLMISSLGNSVKYIRKVINYAIIP